MGVLICKLLGKCMEIGSIFVNEYRFSSILIEKMEDNKFFKIVEVYSLNFLKLNI